MLIASTFLILVLTLAGTRSEFEDDIRGPDVLRELSRSYRYNHPPAFEPDVDEEIIARKERKVRDISDVSVSLKTPEVFSEGTQQTDLTQTRFKESDSPEKIPVTVIYDSEPRLVLGNNKEQTNSTAVKVKRRKHPKRRQPPNKENKPEVKPEEKKVVTSKEAVTDPTPVTPVTARTIVPKIFTKRPPEDNPVIKKIRQRDPVVKIVDEKNFVYSHSGNFHYSYEGGDGTKISSQGELKSINNETTGEAVVGNVFYKDKDGNDFSLSYTADENGYRPQGAHLPTPPPIPPAIARALKYLATATSPEPVTLPTKKAHNKNAE